jgi:hypothetical protein
MGEEAEEMDRLGKGKGRHISRGRWKGGESISEEG